MASGGGLGTAGTVTWPGVVHPHMLAVHWLGAPLDRRPRPWFLS